MTAITKQSNGQITSFIPQADPLAGLPGWIRYMVGAYPQQNPNAMTFAALEEAFDGIDPDVMMAVVKRQALKNVYWPGISELNVTLTEAMREYDLEIYHAPLRIRRHELQETAYAGEYDREAWLELHREYVNIYHGYKAMDIRRKVAEWDKVFELEVA